MTDRITLTFDLSTFEPGHGSPVWWAYVLPICSLLCPSVLHLGPGTRHTDRRTDNGHQCIMPPLYGAGA